jgi:3-hydroxybutyryl-CoA dehydrogenase
VPIDTIAVIGSGIMGRGIAHAAAVGGFRTILHDVSADALERALTTIRRDLDEGITRGKLTAADAAAALKRLAPEQELGAAAGEAGFVIEAVPEEIALKLRTFAKLTSTGTSVVLATNTSGLHHRDRAATRRPGRVVGMHFFNPCPQDEARDREPSTPTA